MAALDNKGSLISEELQEINKRTKKGDIIDKNTINDGLKDVTNNLDNLLIENKKKKDWDTEKIEKDPIPRVKDRGDRVASSLLDDDDRDSGVSPENEKLEEKKQYDKNENENNENDEDLSLDLDEPSAEVMEYARRELGETDEVKCQTLQELREMIYERGECIPHRVDDAFLIRFLRARNFNVNRAHRLVVRYYDFKEQHPDIHQGVDPLKMRHIGDDDAMTVPAYRTQCGRRMMIYRMGNWDPKKYGIEELFKATVIILELGILEPRAQILGGVVIFDLEGITMAHAWSITPQIKLHLKSYHLEPKAQIFDGIVIFDLEGITMAHAWSITPQIKLHLKYYYLEPKAQIFDGIVIFDLEGITMAHAWSITPQIATMVMALMVSAFPMKTHAIHILHQSWIFDMIFAMFRPLLDANMQGRIFFHGDNMESLHRHVATTSLPKKYGGTREELPYYKWIDSLSKKPEIVKEMYRLGYVVSDEILKTIQDII